MGAFDRRHRRVVVRRRVRKLLRSGARGGGVSPSRVGTGKRLHLGLAVHGNRIAVGIQLQAAIRVEHIDAIVNSCISSRG